MKRGEIRWYKFAKPDKKRPVLILTRDSALEFLGEVTVAPITSTVRTIPSEVFLSKSDGMQKDCAITLTLTETDPPLLIEIDLAYYRRDLCSPI